MNGTGRCGGPAAASAAISSLPRKAESLTRGKQPRSEVLPNGGCQIQIHQQTPPALRGGGGIVTTIYRTTGKLGNLGQIKVYVLKKVCSGLDLLLLKALSSSGNHREHQVMCARQTAGEMPAARDSGLAFRG